MFDIYAAYWDGCVVTARSHVIESRRKCRSSFDAYEEYKSITMEELYGVLAKCEPGGRYILEGA